MRFKGWGKLIANGYTRAAGGAYHEIPYRGLHPETSSQLQVCQIPGLLRVLLLRRICKVSIAGFAPFEAAEGVRV